MLSQSITVERLYRDHAEDLGLTLLVGESDLDNVIREPTVNRPGLALAGFQKYFAPKRVQVIGNVETAYLESLDRRTRLQRYRELFEFGFPCVVICRGLKPDRAFLATAQRSKVPVFQTELITMKFISAATLVLETMFAPRTSVHGCMVDIQGVGVVIQGESGIGKSEAVLGLLERGHSLVADDVTLITLHQGHEIVGTAKEAGRNMMEVRGIGLIDVAAMFGISAIRREKRLDLVVTLKAWDQMNGDIDRLGIEQKTVRLLDQEIPTIEIPVRPGRDLARLVEVAALHTKLKLSGYNPAEEFTRKLSQKIQRGLQL